MSFSKSLYSRKIGKIFLWKYKNIFSVFSLVSYSVFFYQFYILDYFRAIIQVFSLSVYSFRKKNRIKGANNLFRRIPAAAFGLSKVFFSSNIIHVYLFYYMDLRYFNNNQLFYLYSRFKRSLDSLKSIIGVQVNLFDCNYFSNLFVPIFFLVKKNYYFFTKHTALISLVLSAQGSRNKQPKSRDFSFLILLYKSFKNTYFFFV